jgi:hypothetical protein
MLYPLRYEGVLAPYRNYSVSQTQKHRPINGPVKISIATLLRRRWSPDRRQHASRLTALRPPSLVPDALNIALVASLSILRHEPTHSACRSRPAIASAAHRQERYVSIELLAGRGIGVVLCEAWGVDDERPALAPLHVTA